MSSEFCLLFDLNKNIYLQIRILRIYKAGEIKTFIYLVS